MGTELKTINIHGKQYVEVSERVRYIREAHPDFRIVTELMSMDADSCLFKASLLNQDNEVLATGHAYEEKSSSRINKTSHVENCETSAVGRCLAMYGVGIENSIASANEVLNAKANAKSNAPSGKVPSGKVPSGNAEPSDKSVENLIRLIEAMSDINDLRQAWKDNVVQINSSQKLKKAFEVMAKKLGQ
jgi:hypothetical protein